MVNIGSGNGLMPDGTKPLPEPMLTYNISLYQSSITGIPQAIPQIAITQMCLKKYPPKLQWYFLGHMVYTRIISAEFLFPQLCVYWYAHSWSLM